MTAARIVPRGTIRDLAANHKSAGNTQRFWIFICFGVGGLRVGLASQRLDDGMLWKFGRWWRKRLQWRGKVDIELLRESRWLDC